MAKQQFTPIEVEELRSLTNERINKSRQGVLVNELPLTGSEVRKVRDLLAQQAIAAKFDAAKADAAKADAAAKVARYGTDLANQAVRALSEFSGVFPKQKTSSLLTEAADMIATLVSQPHPYLVTQLRDRAKAFKAVDL